MSENIIKELLLINSFDLTHLIEQYRLFFLALLPSMFILATLTEYFDQLNVGALIKRAFISILILTSVTSFYTQSIDYSMDAANEKIQSMQYKNILLMDMFSGISHFNQFDDDKKKRFYKDRNVFTGTFAFLKYHMFDKFINDSFTVVVFFIAKLCFLLLKVVYSLIYYLGYGLIGIPCLIYLFPTMGNVLRGGVISYVWCLVLPHVLVFVLSMIGSEIEKGYSSGQVIGGSITGTALLFILTFFIALTPIITAMILNGSGMAQAGGIIGTVGANWIMNLPKKGMNSMASMMIGGPMGPKMALTAAAAKASFNAFKKGGNSMRQGFQNRTSRSEQGTKSNSSSSLKSDQAFSNQNNSSSSQNSQSNEASTQRINTFLSDILKSMPQVKNSIPEKDYSKNPKFSLDGNQYTYPKDRPRSAAPQTSQQFNTRRNEDGSELQRNSRPVRETKRPTS